eukprot:gene3555-13626_t
MMLKPRIVLHSRLISPTVRVIGQRIRGQSWTPVPAPHVRFASLDSSHKGVVSTSYEAFYTMLVAAAIPKLPGRDAQGTERSAMLMPIITSCEDLTSLHKLISNHSQDFNHTHVCAAMEKVVEINVTSANQFPAALAQQLIEELSVLALACVHDMDAQALCSVLGALSKAGGTPNPSLVQKILQHTGAKLHSFDSSDSLQVLWAMAYLGVDSHSGLTHDLLSAGTREPADLLRLDSAAAHKHLLGSYLLSSLCVAAEIGIENEATQKSA